MRAFLLAGVIYAFFLTLLSDAGAAEREVWLDVAELRGGAVPQVRFTASPRARNAAFYARTADGMVQPIRFTSRLTGDTAGPVLQIPAGDERLIRIGGTPGLFVAARTGLKRDREAIFVLVADGEPATPFEAFPTSADIFFRQIAAAIQGQKGALHILPYTISAAGQPPVISGQREALEFEIGFDGVALEAVLTIADVLAVEGDGPLTPVVISLPEAGGSIGFSYMSLASGSEFRDRLGKIVEGSGLSGASVVGHGASAHLTVTAPRQ